MCYMVSPSIIAVKQVKLTLRSPLLGKLLCRLENFNHYSNLLFPLFTHYINFIVLLSSWSFPIAWTKFSFALLGISVNSVYNSDITTSEDKMTEKKCTVFCRCCRVIIFFFFFFCFLFELSLKFYFQAVAFF